MDPVHDSKDLARRAVRRLGYDVHRAAPESLPDASEPARPAATQPVEPAATHPGEPTAIQPVEATGIEATYRREAAEVVARHAAQTAEQVAQLKRKYEQPVFGTVRVWDVIEKLAACIDPTDTRLFCSSQQVHVLQMIEAMDADGMLDDEMLLTALVHDVGKALLLTDEDPANVVCMNSVIGEPEPGIGLANCTFQFNHDEFGWSRLVDHVPPHIAWMTRFHSIDPVQHRHLMDANDIAWADRYLSVLFHYDHEFKSPYRLPRTRISDYRDVIEDAFPRPIRF